MYKKIKKNVLFCWWIDRKRKERGRPCATADMLFVKLFLIGLCKIEYIIQDDWGGKYQALRILLLVFQTAWWDGIGCHGKKSDTQTSLVPMFANHWQQTTKNPAGTGLLLGLFGNARHCFLNSWCPRSDSNRHALRRGILNPLRLPISPPGQVSCSCCCEETNNTQPAFF